MAIVKGAGMVMKAVIEVRHRSDINCTLDYNYKIEHEYDYSAFKPGLFLEPLLFMLV